MNSEYILTCGFLVLTSIIYAFGYFEKPQDKKTFTLFLLLGFCMVLGMNFSRNNITTFIFFELLTLTTYPLIMMSGNKEVGRKYLVYLLGSSTFLLPVIIGKNGSIFLIILGCLKLGYIPLHRWIVDAMVAPTPVSAVLHGALVVGAGGFMLIKIAPENTNHIFAYLAIASSLIAGLISCMQENIKRRLAYSTVSQMSIVLFAVMINKKDLATLQIINHSVAKIGLFYYAGMKTKNPIIIISCLSLIGFPLTLSGFIKQELASNLLYLSSFVSMAYLAPVIKDSFVWQKGKKTKPLMTTALYLTSIMLLYLNYKWGKWHFDIAYFVVILLAFFLSKYCNKLKFIKISLSLPKIKFSNVNLPQIYFTEDKIISIVLLILIFLLCINFQIY